MGQSTVHGVCLLRAVFVMSENLVIYSKFLSPVISHRYGWPTWQPSDKGAMFNHYASQYFKFHIVCLRSKFPPSSPRTHTHMHTHAQVHTQRTLFLFLSFAVNAALLQSFCLSLPSGNVRMSGVCCLVRKEEVMLTQCRACHAS